jgi:hypothetical protein
LIGPVVRRLAPVAAGVAFALAVGAPGAGAPRSQERDAPAVDEVSSPAAIVYSIDVTLDPSRDRLTGESTVQWTNRTSRLTDELRLRLAYNGVAGGSIDVTAVRIGDLPANPITTGVELRIPFATPVEPGEARSIRIGWTARVPRDGSIPGAHAGEFFLDGWFPEVAVFDERGWQVDQAAASSRRHAPFADYDVRVTAPTGWTIAATGREQTRRENVDGTSTVRYLEKAVNGFVWTAGRRWIESRQRIERGPDAPPIEVRLLLVPDHADQLERYRNATELALKRFSEWFGPYPYDHLTIVDAPWNAVVRRTDFPLLVAVESRWLAPARASEPERSIVTAIAGQWWSTAVAFDETREWPLAGGLRQYAAQRLLAEEYPNTSYVARFFGGHIAMVFRAVPLATAALREGPPADQAAAVARWLLTAERYFGWPTLQSVLWSYFRTHRFGFASELDLQHLFEETTGRELTWFFDLIDARRTLDFRVGAVKIEPVETSSGRRFRTVVDVTRVGDGIFPGTSRAPYAGATGRGAIQVQLDFAGGERVVETWDGRDRVRSLTYVAASPIVAVQIDPDHVIAAETGRVGNSWTARSKSSAVSLAWSGRWMLWLQDHLLSVAALI